MVDEELAWRIMLARYVMDEGMRVGCLFERTTDRWREHMKSSVERMMMEKIGRALHKVYNDSLFGTLSGGMGKIEQMCYG
jgi:hypothetical protein